MDRAAPLTERRPGSRQKHFESPGQRNRVRTALNTAGRTLRKTTKEGVCIGGGQSGKLGSHSPHARGGKPEQLLGAYAPAQTRSPIRVWVLR